MVQQHTCRQETHIQKVKRVKDKVGVSVIIMILTDGIPLLILYEVTKDSNKEERVRHTNF